MEKLYEALDNLFEELLEESAKTDFIDKFGQDVFNNFEKAKQRLKNNGFSTDYQQYLKKTKEELIDFLASLYDDEKDSQKKRIILGTDKEIRGKYNYLGEKNGFKVYQPLDTMASIDLGVNTGWCTAGRYRHYGHPEFTPSLDDAKKHWDEYTSKGVKFYYFLDPNTMYGEYAVALYPEVLKVNIDNGEYFIKRTNVEIYDAEDSLDYSLLNKLPLDLIPEKIICEYDELKEVEIEDEVLIKYRGQDSEFTIPDGVVSIEENAFYGCDSLKSITIPNSVIFIGNGAFSWCKSLRSIVIPNNVTFIGKEVFCGCESLESVTIQNGVTSISNSAFNGCYSLTSIDIPNSVTSIGDEAFSGCRSLKSVTIHTGVTSIGNYAFYECVVLTSIAIPDSVISIGEGAFVACASLTSIDIPNSVTSIGACAFDNCESLKLIIIPNSVTSIDFGTFSGCSSLKSIVIPNSVTSIDAEAFNGCESVVVKTNNSYVSEYCNRFDIKVQPLHYNK